MRERIDLKQIPELSCACFDQGGVSIQHGGVEPGAIDHQKGENTVFAHP